MGERIASIGPSFNRSIHFKGRPERLSSEAGAILLREADERLGLSQYLSAKLKDRRDPRFIQHSIRELLRTAIILLGVRLRPGNVQTAEGGLDFNLEMVTSAQEKLCKVAAVRMDAGIPKEETLKGLEEAAIPYVARIKNNKVLDVMAEPYLARPVGRPSLETRTSNLDD